MFTYKNYHKLSFVKISIKKYMYFAYLKLVMGNHNKIISKTLFRPLGIFTSIVAMLLVEMLIISPMIKLRVRMLRGKKTLRRQ